ncbi:unnamed protein product, partial [Mesorhabditis spiculigera]
MSTSRRRASKSDIAHSSSYKSSEDQSDLPAQRDETPPSGDVSESTRPDSPSKSERSSTGSRNMCCVVTSLLLILAFVFGVGVYMWMVNSLDEPFDNSKEARLMRQIQHEFGPLETGGPDPKMIINMWVLVIDAPHDSIELYSKGLDIAFATLFSSSPADTRRLSVAHNDTLERIALAHRDQIPAGTHHVQIAYKGTINEGLHGFYRTSPHGGAVSALMNLEATHARRVVPCFDEPRFLANWTLSVRHPKNTTATSNMPMTSGFPQPEIDGEWTRTRFEPTPPLPPHRLALAIHNLGHETGTLEGRVRVSAYAREARSELSKELLNVTVELLAHFEAMLGLEYPLQKLDVIIVHGVSRGMVASLGLITVDQKALIDSSGFEAVPRLQLIAGAVAEGLAKQWLGNMVTMRWWDDLWLSEGFSSFCRLFAYRYYDIAKPYQQPDDLFMAEHLAPLDAEPGYPLPALRQPQNDTDPFNKWPRTPLEIASVFEPRSLLKSAHGIYTMYRSIGSERFWRMVKGFLTNNSYSTVTSADLWEHDLNKDDKWQRAVQAHQDFLRVRGYPRIDVIRQAINPNKYTVTASPFRYSKTTPMEEESRPDDFWHLPIVWAERPEMREPDYLRDGELLVVNSPRVPCINPGRVAYARVNYWAHWADVRANILTICPNPYTRATLYSDVFAMAEAGVEPYSRALQFLQLIPVEPDNAARRALGAQLDKVNRRLLANGQNQSVVKLVEAVGKFYEHCEDYGQMETPAWCLEMNNKSDWATVFRTDVQDSCEEGVPTSNCSRIPEATRLFVYCKAAEADEHVAEYIWQKLGLESVTPSSLDELDTLSEALLCSKEWKYPQRVLDVFSDRRLAEKLTFLAGRQADTSQLVDYFVANFGRFLERLRDDPYETLRLIRAIQPAIRTDAHVEKIKSLLTTPDLPDALKAAWLCDEAFERHRLEHEWHAKYSANILDFYSQMNVAK